MKKQLFTGFSFCALILLAYCPAQAGDAGFGEIVYPALGNIRGGEGTILVKFRVDEPLAGEEGTWFQPNPKSMTLYSIAEIKTNDQNRLLTFVRKPGKGRALWTSMSLEAFPPNSPNLNEGGEEWKPGDVVYIAYTWDIEGNHALWADGVFSERQQSAELQRGMGIADDSSEGYIKFGSKRRGSSSAISLYAIHVLDTALTEEDFEKPASELWEASEDTLLLDLYGDQEAFVPGQSLPKESRTPAS